MQVVPTPSYHNSHPQLMSQDRAMPNKAHKTVVARMRSRAFRKALLLLCGAATLYVAAWAATIQTGEETCRRLAEAQLATERSEVISFDPHRHTVRQAASTPFPSRAEHSLAASSPCPFLVIVRYYAGRSWFVTAGTDVYVWIPGVPLRIAPLSKELYRERLQGGAT